MVWLFPVRSALSQTDEWLQFLKGNYLFSLGSKFYFLPFYIHFSDRSEIVIWNKWEQLLPPIQLSGVSKNQPLASMVGQGEFWESWKSSAIQYWWKLLCISTSLFFLVCANLQEYRFLCRLQEQVYVWPKGKILYKSLKILPALKSDEKLDLLH